MYWLYILPLAVVLYVLGSIRVLRQYERGVVFLLGKFEGVRGAGLTLVFVPIQQMVRVSLRTVTMQIPSQKIITKDNVSIDIAAVAYYHISDPEKAVIVIENVYNAINQISQTTVRNVVGRFSLDQLLSDTASINEQIKNVIDGHTEPWGTQVTAVEIKDITLPDNMQRAMAKEAEAERERRAKIVAAEGEYQASVKLGQAADIITQHPVALASHAADDGGNCDRKKFNHHLPRTIYDDSAGSHRHVEQGFSFQITSNSLVGSLMAEWARRDRHNVALVYLCLGDAITLKASCVER
jgi:regulator of protease activity HflC (stomatin/prohibitin superfamily)